MNETLEGVIGMERLEDLERIERRLTRLVSTNDIALLASKRRGFNVYKERALIAKASMTKCACRHYSPLSNGVCTYRSCRHGQTHNTIGLVV